MKGTKGHRERKNGASREQWMESKAATNAARPKQEQRVIDSNGEFIRATWVRE